MDDQKLPTGALITQGPDAALKLLTKVNDAIAKEFPNRDWKGKEEKVSDFATEMVKEILDNLDRNECLALFTSSCCLHGIVDLISSRLMGLMEEKFHVAGVFDMTDGR